LITFEQTDGVTVPHPNGGPAAFARVPAFTSPADGLALTLTGVTANGGGTAVNRFTFIFDVLMPGGLNWMPFFNTNPANANDSDFFVRGDGAIGIGALGYAPAGSFQPDTWHRIAFTADLAAGEVAYYIDGTQVHRRTGGALTDGRFSLYSDSSPAPHVMLFGDENSETHEVLVASIAFVDRPLAAQEIAALGGTKAPGIFLTATSPNANLTIRREGANIRLDWQPAPSRRLQWSTTLRAPWTDLPATTGASTHTEPITPPLRFFRAAD
jgi:hypothetical protein